MGTILRKLCENKEVAIHAAEACPDRVHMLVSMPPHILIRLIENERLFVMFILLFAIFHNVDCSAPRAFSALAAEVEARGAGGANDTVKLPFGIF